MSSVVPLAIHPWPLPPERLDLLKQAKATLSDIDVKVYPTEAVVSAGVRVLSFAGRPPFVCSYAPVENPLDVASIASALRLVLTTPAGAPPFDEAAWLTEVCGVPINLIETSEIKPKVQFE